MIHNTYTINHSNRDHNRTNKMSLKYPSAFLLAKLGGNDSPSAADLKKIITSAGGEFSDDDAKLFMDQMEGKDATELVAAGREKLASMGSGGGGGGAAAPAAGGAAAEAAPAAAAVEEEEEEEDMDFDLFG